MNDAGAQALMIMLSLTAYAARGAVLPATKEVVGASLHAVSHIGRAGADAVGKYYRDGEVTMKALEKQGDVNFIQLEYTDLAEYRDNLKARGVDFKVERVEGLDRDQARLWYIGEDSEKIRAAIMDVAAKYVGIDKSEQAVGKAHGTPAKDPASKAVQDAAEKDPAWKQGEPTERQAATIQAFKERGLVPEDAVIQTKGEASKLIDGVLEKNPNAIIDSMPENRRQQWRSDPFSDKQAAVIENLKQRGLVPEDATYKTRGEASDLIDAGMRAEEGRPRNPDMQKTQPFRQQEAQGAPSAGSMGPEPTREQMEVIADMRGTGRLSPDMPEPKSSIEAHGMISDVIGREADERDEVPGGSFSSAKEATAWAQGKMACAAAEKGVDVAKDLSIGEPER